MNNFQKEFNELVRVKEMEYMFNKKKESRAKRIAKYRWWRKALSTFFIYVKRGLRLIYLQIF